MVVFGFIANRLNVGITGLEAGSGNALHSEVERSGGHAVASSPRASRSSAWWRSYFPIFEAHAHEASAGVAEERRATEDRPGAPC